MSSRAAVLAAGAPDHPRDVSAPPPAGDEGPDDEGLDDGEPFDDDGELEYTEEPDEEGTPPSVMAGNVSLALLALQDSWSRGDRALSTRLVQFDRLMAGGIRAGDLIVLQGPAKAGKTAFVGQVVYELARSGALGIYTSVEMPRAEMISRWLVREAFLEAYRKADSGDWPLSFAEVAYGNTHRGETRSGSPLKDDETRERVQARLERAVEAVRSVGARLVVEQLPPASTPAALRAIAERAKAKTGHRGVTVLVVDPAQRLFADPSGECTGDTLARINADEAARLAMVGQQLKQLVDDEDLRLAMLVVSDTTSGVAYKGGVVSSTDVRGAYMLDAIGTTIVNMSTTPSLDMLREVHGIDVDAARQRINEHMLTGLDAKGLGACVAIFHCSGQRRGPAKTMVYTCVPGAMTFAEKPGLDRKTLVTMPPPTKGSRSGPRSRRSR